MHVVFKKILGDPQAKTVKRLRKRVKSINDLAGKYQKLSDKELREQTEVLKKTPQKRDARRHTARRFCRCSRGVQPCAWHAAF
jgi:preprotein translocase subunit SecA